MNSVLLTQIHPIFSGESSAKVIHFITLHKTFCSFFKILFILTPLLKNLPANADPISLKQLPEIVVQMYKVLNLV